MTFQERLVILRVEAPILSVIRRDVNVINRCKMLN